MIIGVIDVSMDYAQIVAVVVFLLAYAIIISEKIHRAIVALTGAVTIILLGVLDQESAVEGVDFNTLGLLVGMMIIVAITRRSGVFEYLAIKCAKIAKGEPLMILVLLTLVTAILSAFLDNVTTVLLIVPVTFAITDRLSINPIPFLYSEIIGSNIGGTSTLIGDPPNIMIGSSTHLGFLDFLVNLGPVVIPILAITILIMTILYRKSLVCGEEQKQRVMDMEELDAIKEWNLLKKSLVVLALTIMGFFLHQALHLESATVALTGAMLLMLVTKREPEEILLEIEWPTLFFFIGLFVLVEGLVHVGIIEYLAGQALVLTSGNYTMTAFLILWFSGLASAFVDNIPMVAAMIPLLKSIGQLTGMPMDPLWWSLALGACLGGNGTLIGASANVVVAGISEKKGIPITFMGFLKVGFPFMIVSLLISSLYLYLRYLI